MNFIEKHKALIITSLLMGIVILSLYNIGLSQRIQGKNELLIDLTEVEKLLEEIEELKEETKPLEEQKLIAQNQRTHDAYNEDFEDPDEGSFEERLKALTEPTNEPEDTSEETEDTEGEAVIPEEKEEVETAEKGEKNDGNPEAPDKKVNNRASSISWSLKGRDKVDLPNPIYTCNSSGKVVVTIQVSQYGNVLDAKINKKSSTTRNECLFDNALEYARNARFTKAETSSQIGTITYFFNYKS